MANAPKYILSVSYDESLLRTREWVLQTAGFKVTSALGFKNALKQCRNGRFDLVIIGHSIPREQINALIDAVNAQDHTRLLVLRMPGDAPLRGTYHSLMASEGPEALISAVKTAFGMDPSSPRQNEKSDT